MIESAIAALGVVLEPGRLVWLCCGTAVGLVVGFLPGLGGVVGMAILLPFIFGMDPYDAIALLIGTVAVLHTSDTFTSILIGVPGTAGSAATVVEGYPMAQRGEAARALSASFMASMLGGIIGGAGLFGFVVIAKPLILALGSPELFMLSLLGMATVGVLAKANPAAGLVAGAVGMMLGSIGAAPAAAEYRYTFHTIYLYDGIPLPVLGIGLYGIPALIDLLSSKAPVSQGELRPGQTLQGIKDVFSHKLLVLRSSLLGAGLGVIPGIGGSVVDWIAYALAAAPSDRANFGKGDIRGLIAPESANNAKEGGSLVPTLLFGIPGSGTTAVLLGGFFLVGIEPGPAMVGKDLTLTLSIIWTLTIASALGAGCCWILSRAASRLCLINGTKLVPYLFIIMAMAAYQASRSWGDIIAMLALSVVGWIMQRLDWPRPAVLVGFVLSVPTERYLHLSMGRYGFDWLRSPAVIAIGICIAVLVFFSMRAAMKHDKDAAKLRM
ncbi:MAG TPA: tripartite tricarboxylate transporter permease [Dongiaceae bacterium]|nr:tripartite tricarboxylate transporter permease [Dongiaceae bacterium]